VRVCVGVGGVVLCRCLCVCDLLIFLQTRQKNVAVYLIDQLALRVGNEKNTDEEADTVSGI